MPKLPIPDEFRELLESTSLANLASVDANGRPQVNPVWFIWDGTNILIGVREDTLKYRNLRGNPNLAISILDPADPFRYLELRGSIVEFHHYNDLSFVNQLSQKYTGKDFPPDTLGDSRYRLTMEISSWIGR